MTYGSPKTARTALMERRIAERGLGVAALRRLETLFGLTVRVRLKPFCDGVKFVDVHILRCVRSTKSCC